MNTNPKKISVNSALLARRHSRKKNATTISWTMQLFQSNSIAQGVFERDK
jgi:hypothetical protein